MMGEPMMGELIHVKLTLTPGTVDTWRELAVRLGYIVTSGGPCQGLGNISELMRIVAQGIDLGLVDLSGLKRL